MAVSCPFYAKCQNADKECHHCKYNALCTLGSFLSLVNEEGKPIRFL